MVKAPCALALALASSGCLGKPPFPFADAAVSDDAQDATLNPDAAPGCLGRTAFPADLNLRRQAEVGNIDRRDDGTADDIVVIGRVSDGQPQPQPGQAFAYLLQGHPQLTGQCYDRRYEFVQNHDVEPIDAWLGEASGDALPDLLLLGRETDRIPQEAEVLLYAGDAAQRQPASRAALAFSLNNGFDNANPWGGTVESPSPAYVLAWARSAPPIRHVFAGALYPHPASISVAPNPLAFGTALTATLPNPAVPITANAVQEVAVHTLADPHELVVLAQFELLRVRYVDNASGSAFEIGGTVATAPPHMRFARFARRPVDIGGVMTTIGATQRDPTGYFLIRVDGPFTKPPTIDPFPTGPDPSGSLDIAIAFVDANPKPDLVTLTVEGSDAILNASPNLDFSLASVRADSLVQLRITNAMNDDYGILAVGDFDGIPTTPEQILVISTTPGLHPTKCFTLASGAFVPCT